MKTEGNFIKEKMNQNQNVAPGTKSNRPVWKKILAYILLIIGGFGVFEVVYGIIQIIKMAKSGDVFSGFEVIILPIFIIISIFCIVAAFRLEKEN